MTDEQQNLQELSRIVGAEVLTAERSPWGFENRTEIVTLRDGQRLVVQRISNRAQAAQKLQLGARLPERLEAVGIHFPRQLRAQPEADPPYAIREFLPGLPGATLMGRVEGTIQVAGLMGALLPALRQVATDKVGLDVTWSTPARLAQAAEQWLLACAQFLTPPMRAALRETITILPELFEGRVARFAHGDFCPVNVLLEPAPDSESYRVAGLLDVEFARIADPLFDAAWWSWVVRYHHEERWRYAWPVLLTAAGLPDDAATQARIAAIQRLRCLEFIADMAPWNERAAQMWVERLATTLTWASASPRERN